MRCEGGPARPSLDIVCLAQSSPSPAAALLGIALMLLACSSRGLAAVASGYQVLDLIQSLNSSGTDSRPGLRYTAGPNVSSPALLLEDSERHLEVPKFMTQQALRLLLDPSEVSFLFTVLQEVGDSGTLLSFSTESYRFIEIESNSKRDEIRVSYTHQKQTRVETFPYRLADGRWHLLAVSLGQDQMSLFVDCSRIYQRAVPAPDRVSPVEAVSLFLGQRSGQLAMFRGALQDVKVVTQARGYLLQCPQQDTDCPTCTKYQDLEQQVKQMSNMYKDLTIKLSKAEERLQDLERCECQKPCQENDGTLRQQGEEWRRDNCSVCRCQNGTVQCQSQPCPAVNCPNPVYREGNCCPVCPTNCYYSSKYYAHGESISPRACVTCTCSNGRMVCERQDTEQTCPKLDCPKSERIEIHGQCCPVCRGTDFCLLGNTCHENATCINLATKFACQCHAGFEGDGHICQDVDECSTTGGPQGHHCNGDTVCINTPGSYRCDCPRGHSRLETYQCAGTSSSAPWPSTISPTSLLVMSLAGLFVLQGWL